MTAIAAVLLSVGSAAAEPIEYTLENGLRVRIAADPKAKKTMVVLALKAGFCEEPAGLPHLAHVTEHLTVFDVKDPVLAKTVADWFPKRKAFAETMADEMYFDLYPDAEELVTALKIQAARLAAVEFRKETLAREMPLTLAEIDVVEKNERFGPVKFVLGPWVQAAYHGKTDLPMRAVTKKITLEQAQAFHERTFRPDRAVLLVSGDLDAAEVRKAIDKEFAGLKKPAKAAEARPLLKPGAVTTEWDVATRHLLIAWQMPELKDDDHPAMTLAAVVLQTHLFSNKEITTRTRSCIVLAIDGALLVNIQLQPDAEADTVRDKVLELVEGLGKDGVPEARLRFARAQLLLSVKGGGAAELGRLFAMLRWGDVEAYGKRLDAVKAEQIDAAMRKHLSAKLALVVRVEPAKKP